MTKELRIVLGIVVALLFCLYCVYIGYMQGQSNIPIENNPLNGVYDMYQHGGCTQNTAGYIDFKIWKNDQGNYEYTCLIPVSYAGQK